MQCNCGSKTIESTHNVTTLKFAESWVKEPVDPSALPLTVYQDTCKPCGRLIYRVWDNNNNLLKKFG